MLKNAAIVPPNVVTAPMQAIAINPVDADAYYNLGNALSSQHKMTAAVAAYQQALRLEPDSERYQKRLQALGVPTN